MDELLDSWMLHLRAERKSQRTLNTYANAVRMYLRWCNQNGHKPALTRDCARAFTVDVIERNSAATASLYTVVLKLFSAWLTSERITATDELVGLKAPRVPAKLVPVLTWEERKALLDTCVTRRPTFMDVRDDAIIRLFMDTGIRASEMAGLQLADVDTRECVITVTGKGSKPRLVPFSAGTAVAIDRYTRSRVKRPRAAIQTALWLGHHGQLRYDGLYFMIKRRGEQAGIKKIHPHMLRHTFADQWLSRGGSEGGLMAVAGWARREMLDRYGAANRSTRAIEEARRLMGENDG